MDDNTEVCGGRLLNAVGRDGSNVLRFAASLRWNSSKNLKPNGALFIEGYIKSRGNLDGVAAIFAPADTSEIRRQKINQLFSVEGATLDLLNHIVAPVVFGDAYWLPEMKRSGVDVAERLQLR